MRLTKVARFGLMIVFQRNRKHETWLPLYVVGHRDGRMLEEFRRKASAIKWARENAEG